MKNTHEHFGKLVSMCAGPRRPRPNIRVHLDAFTGEERGKAHFRSVIGGDVAIGAIAAAFGLEWYRMFLRLQAPEPIGIDSSNLLRGVELHQTA